MESSECKNSRKVSKTDRSHEVILTFSKKRKVEILGLSFPSEHTSSNLWLYHQENVTWLEMVKKRHCWMKSENVRVNLVKVEG